MSLENLVGRSLETIEPDSASLMRLIRAAKRNIQDAHIEAVSTENRFDVSYKAIMQLANAALLANGYRTLSSRPGHHMTMIQSLPLTIGIDSDTLIVLDTLRKQRNATDYSGDIVPESAMRECLSRAEDLYRDVYEWIKENKSDLLAE